MVGIAIAAPAPQPHSPAVQCGHTVTAKSAHGFIETVWDEAQWERGSPGPKALKAWRHKLKCAAGPDHRAAMKDRWRKAKRSYHRHRVAMLATRCGSPTCNRQLGEKVLVKHGVTGAELDCSLELGDRESEWDEEVFNFGGSGAYGIAQALPASKYPSEGQPGAPHGWRKAKAQILWMIDYVFERYGSFCGAIAWHNAHNWY